MKEMKEKMIRKVRRKKAGKRFLAWFLAAALVIPMVNALFPAQKVEAAQEKMGMDENAYRAMGFDVSSEIPDEGYFGNGKTVLNAQKELYFDFNGSSNYGYLIRDNLNLSQSIEANDLEAAGAYRRYGQYRNGDWAKLNEKNGYHNGKLGGKELGKEFTSDTHQPIAYTTSTEYKSASGKEDHVAKLVVYASKQRCDLNVNLEIYDFVKRADEKGGEVYAPRQCASVNLGNPVALDESGSMYNEQYDALFEVTAGDYDGDGVDEIAVYYADNEIRIYKTNNDRLTHWQSIRAEEISANTGSVMTNTDSKDNAGKERAAVVTLASGDLQKDFTEDLAIGVSMPGAGLNAEKNNAFIYGYSKKTGRLEKDKTIRLGNFGDENTPLTMMGTNVAIGDLSGNGRQELVVAGRVYYCTNTMQGSTWTPLDTMAAVHVEYDFNKHCYDVQNPQIFKDHHFSTTFLNNIKYGPGKYATPIGLSICNFGTPGNSEARLFLYSQLYSYIDGSFSRTDEGICITTDQKNNANEKCNKDEVWVSQVKSGNFIGDPAGSNQMIAIIGVKEKGKDKYWYYLSYFAKRNGSWVTGWEGIINQATSYLNNTNKRRASAWVSLSTPDLDEDATVLEYMGAEMYYTKPEVQAVMQSAPYFQAVEDISDNYLDDGSTAYGTGKGSGNAVTASIEASVGAYVSGEISLFAEGEFESTVSATTSFEHQTAWETSTSVEYAGNAGDDYVVMYTIPYHRFWYTYLDEDAKQQYMTIEEPMTPATVILPVDTYDAMAENYKGLEPIRGNLLRSTPGEPFTYQNTFSGEYTNIGSVQMLTNAGGNSGSAVTVSQEETVNNEESFSVGTEIELKAGGGAGLFGTGAKAGTVVSTAIAAGYVHSRMGGVTYTATVDNLPAGVTGYGFNWQFGAQKKKLNGESVILLGYNLTNVKEAPRPPKDLAITEIGSREMMLEWKGTSSAAYYDLMLITNNGMELPQAVIPSTQADEDGNIRYKVSNLLPNTQYSYQVVAVDGLGAESIPSVTVTGTTLSEADTGFRIAKQPEDKQVYVGGTAVFELEMENSTNQSLNYRWQKYDADSGSWKYMNTGYNRRLTLTASSELDGSLYRCIVYTGGTVLTSNAARLTIGKSSSVTGLTVEDASGNILSDRAVVQSSGAVTEEVKVGTREVPYTVTVEIDGVVYTKMEDEGGNILWEMKDTEGKSRYYANQALTGGDSPLIGEGAELSGESVCVFVTYRTPEEGEENPEIDKTYEAGERMEIPADAQTPEDVTVTSWSGCYETENGYIFEAKILEEGDEGTKYYLSNGTEVFFSDGWQCITIEETKINMRDLVKVTETRTEDVMAQQTKVAEGDRLTFTAEVRDGESYVTDNAPSFQILNTTTGVSSSVAAVREGNVYTAQYVFTEPGVYEVTAVYAGSDRYQFSRSDSLTLIIKGADAHMSISGGTMTYGETLDLNPVILDKDGEQTADEPILYTVQKGNQTLSGAEMGISGNFFTPSAIGTYRITAKNTRKNITASSTVTVTKRTLTITPADLEASVGESRAEKTEKLDATKIFTNSQDTGKVRVQGLVAGDTLSYALKSDALTATRTGEYPIVIEQVASTALDNYTLVQNSGTYTLTQDRVRVTAQAGANGKLRIYYEASDNGAPIEIQSGTYIPKGSSLIVSAQPSTGFGIEKWEVNGKRLNHTNNEFTIESLGEDTDVNVSFSYHYSVLRYSGVGNGSVSGKYAGTGESAFVSGGRLNQNQSVVLTAKPSENFVVDYWEIQRGTNGWERIKASDQTSDHTGETYTVSNVNADTQVRVYFKNKTERTVTLQFQDCKNGQTVFSAGTSLKVNGKSVTAENKKYTFASFDGDNLTFDITVPDNMLVDHWAAVGSDGRETVVADGVKQFSVYNLKGDGQYIVYCSIPNQGRVTWGKVLDDTHKNGGTLDAAGTITADAGENTVLTLPQGTDVTFTAVPEEGYRISKWTVNGAPASPSQLADIGNGAQRCTISVGGDDSVQVYFEKKPTVSYRKGANGNLLLMGSGGELASGSFIDFGSGVTWTITANAGYAIDTVALNNVNITEDCMLASGNSDIRYYTLEDIHTNQILTATFRKKPTITYEAKLPEGCVAAKVGDETIASGGWVEYGSTVDWTITPAEGYAVERATLNGEDMTDRLVHDGTTQNIMTYSTENVQKDMIFMVEYAACVKVTAAAGTNGAVSLSYQATKNSQPVEIESGMRIPKGAKLIVTAKPSEGFAVDTWVVDGKALESKEAEYTVKALEADTDIQVSFVYQYHTLSYEADGNGSIRGVYAGEDGQTFVSGGRLNPGQSVVLTAVPDENFVVDDWEIKEGNGDWTRIKAADQMSDYTGVAYTVSNVREDTQVRVHFKSKTARTVTLQFKDGANGQTAFSAGTSLKVNGVSVAAENKQYTIASFDGDNLTFDVTTPDNMLVDHWARIDSDGREMVVADGVKQLSVYDLEGDCRYTVYCSIPNQGRVTWGKALDDAHKNGGTLDAAGTVTADAGEDAVLTLPQGTDVTFTAVPEEGYRISKWTVNGAPASPSQLADIGNGAQRCTISVGGDDSVQVYFEKKPTVSYRRGAHGSILLTGSGGELASGSFVEFGSDVTWTVTADAGYAIDQITLNHEDITEDCIQASGNDDICYDTLTDVQTNQILSATFRKKPTLTYEAEQTEGCITAKTGEETIVSGGWAAYGSTVDWTITPAEGYAVERAVLNGEDVTDRLVHDGTTQNIMTYSTENVQKDMIFMVEYAACVKVTAAAGTNGAVSLSYQATKNSQPVEIESGMRIPKGAKLIVTAKPSEGFAVDTWVADGRTLADRGLTYIVESLEADTDIRVSFVYQYHTLSYEADGNGSIRGVYAGEDGQTFVSGGRLNPGQSVVLTAVPDENFVVDDWEIKEGNGDWTRIKAADQMSDYTGVAYTVSNVREDTQVRVHFKSKTARTVTLQFKEHKGNQTAFREGTSLKVNGKPVEAAGRIYTYETFEGDNLVLDITVPDNILVDHWTLADSEGTEVTAANNVKQLKIYDLDGDRQYTVYCAMPNQGQVSWGKALDLTHENGGSVEAAGTIAADAGTDEVLTLPQGADVIFTAAPAEGYQISKWTRNGSVIAADQLADNGNGSQSYTMIVGENDSILVYFEKLPMITYHAEPEAGTVCAQAGAAQISSGSFLEFGSTVAWTIVPEHGYVVESVKVTDSKDGAQTDVTEDLRCGEENPDIRLYTLEHVNTDTELAVTFRMLEKPYMLKYETADLDADGVGDNGMILAASERAGSESYRQEQAAALSGSIAVYEDGEAALTPIPDAAHRVKACLVNGESVGLQADGTLRFTAEQFKEAGGQISVIVQFGVGAPVITFGDPVFGTETIGTVRAEAAGAELTSGAAAEGTVTFTAEIPEEHYEIAAWTVNGSVVEDAAGTGFVYENAARIDSEVAVLLQGVKLDVSACAKEENTGTVSGLPETVRYRDEVTLQAEPAAGYVFDGWYLGEEKVSANATFPFVAETDAAYAAQFVEKQKKQTYTITIENTAHGTVTAKADGSDVTAVEEGTEVTFTACPDANWNFAGWTINGQETEGAKTLVWTAGKDFTEDLTVKAAFSKAVYYEVNYGVEGENGTVTASTGEGNISSDTAVELVGGSTLTFTAQPEEGYMVAGWTINGVLAEENLSTELMIEKLAEKVDVKVSFEPYVGYRIPESTEDFRITDVKRTPDDTSPAEEIRRGGTVTFTMTPPEGTRFTGLEVYGADCMNMPLGTGQKAPAGDRESVVTAVKNENDSYTITIENVGKEITANAQTALALDQAQVAVAGNQTFVYNGRVQIPAQITVTLNGIILTEDDYDVVYRDNRDAGTAKATITGKGDYIGTAVGTWEIQPKPLTIFANDAKKYLGYDDPQLTYRTEGLVSGDTLRVTVKREAGEKEGTYAITAAAQEHPNYQMTFRNGTFEITGKDPGVTNSLNAGLGSAWKGKKLTVKWGKVPMADGYDIFASRCGRKNAMKLAATAGKGSRKIKLSKISGKKLRTAWEYKFKVQAYRMVNGEKVYLAESYVCHRAGRDSKYLTNAKKVKVKKKTYNLRVGKKVKIKVNVVKENAKKRLLKHNAAAGKGVRFWSSDETVAAVTAKGRVTAAAKGTCTIYVMADDGVKAKIKVKVR